MANLNRVMLIGRLTREPEIKEFEGGGKVANMGFAVNNRRRNQASGEWEEVPVWLTLKAFNRESGRKLADLAEKHLHKGQQAYVEGHLALEEWAGKEDGKKQSRLTVYVDSVEFLDGHRTDGAAGQHGDGAAAEPAAAGPVKRAALRPTGRARAAAAAEKKPALAGVSGLEEIPF